MDTTDQNIIFDENGVCDHCNTYYNDIFPKWKSKLNNENNLELILNKIRVSGKNKDYDCIIGVSGGIDSSYLTYLVKNKFKLRPLIFHVDAGWNSQIAVENIGKLLDHLDLDLFTEVVDWEEVRDLQIAFLKSGVPHIDVPQDHAFFATMYKYANLHDINFILTGGNYSTECIRNPKEWMYFQSDERQLRDIHNKFGSKKLKNYPITSILWHKFYLPVFKNVKVLRLLDFVPYNKNNAIRTLQKQIDWVPYNQKHFESRFTRFYEGYWLLNRFGFDTRKVQFSSLILTNQMTRGRALELLKKQPLTNDEIKTEKEFVASKLKISISELENFFNLPKKTYRDYKNQELLYNFGSKIFRFLNLELGGKR